MKTPTTAEPTEALKAMRLLAEEKHAQYSVTVRTDSTLTANEQNTPSSILDTSATWCKKCNHDCKLDCRYFPHE